MWMMNEKNNFERQIIDATYSTSPTRCGKKRHITLETPQGSQDQAFTEERRSFYEDDDLCISDYSSVID